MVVPVLATTLAKPLPFPLWLGRFGWRRGVCWLYICACCWPSDEGLDHVGEHLDDGFWAAMRNLREIITLSVRSGRATRGSIAVAAELLVDVVWVIAIGVKGICVVDEGLDGRLLHSLVSLGSATGIHTSRGVATVDGPGYCAPLHCEINGSRGLGNGDGRRGCGWCSAGALAEGTIGPHSSIELP